MKAPPGPGGRGASPQVPEARLASRGSGRARAGGRRGIAGAIAGSERKPARAGPEVNVLDLLLLAASVAFFLASLAYARGCECL